jgi:hypothetical protein
MTFAPTIASAAPRRAVAAVLATIVVSGPTPARAGLTSDRGHLVAHELGG